MDPKEKANFIHAVSTEPSIVCPQCGAENEAGSKFCLSCGTSLPAETPVTGETAFASVSSQKEEPLAPAAPSAPVIPAAVEAEVPSAFAEGLPDWSIEPPQVVVRRKHK